MIPSFEALRRHWLRSCWVLHMWRQAQVTGTMALEPLIGNGWLKDQEGKLAIDWESEENITKVKSRVDLVLKGCSCKAGCTTNRCGCRKKRVPCGVGCGCSNCTNHEDLYRIEEADANQHDSSNEDSDASSSDERDDTTQAYVNQIMKEVFGEQNYSNDSSDEYSD